jgi:hypothetical protein
MRFAPQNTVADPIGFYPGEAVQSLPLGSRVVGNSYDYNATAGVINGGGAEFLYVKAVATHGPGTLVSVDKDWNILATPATANTGRPAYVTISDFTATNCYGWIMVSGMCPIKTSVAATVGPVFVGTAGLVTPTAAAGKALLGATCLVAASATFTKSGKTKKGSKFIEVADVGGLYPGLVPSGTGIAAGTIESIDPGGTGFSNSAVATATGTVTVTFTHTGYGIFHIDHPHVQGQIT